MPKLTSQYLAYVGLESFVHLLVFQSAYLQVTLVKNRDKNSRTESENKFVSADSMTSKECLKVKEISSYNFWIVSLIAISAV